LHLDGLEKPFSGLGFYPPPSGNNEKSRYYCKNMMGHTRRENMKHLYGLLFLFVVLIGSSVQPGQRIWEVTCGLPQQDNPFLELMPAGYSGPWFGSQDK